MSFTSQARTGITRTFAGVEDLVYVGLGALLAGLAVVLLVNTFVSFAHSFATDALSDTIAHLLDRILLILLVVELLYTVQVSFREHALLPEPFLLIGLIAGVRRVLVLTAEFGEGGTKSPPMIEHFVMELAVLTILILALSISLYVLRRQDAQATAAGAADRR